MIDIEAELQAIRDGTPFQIIGSASGSVYQIEATDKPVAFVLRKIKHGSFGMGKAIIMSKRATGIGKNRAVKLITEHLKSIDDAM